MDYNKTALYYQGEAYSYQWLSKKLPELAAMLEAQANNDTLALQLTDPFEMALAVLAGFQSDLCIYLLHPSSAPARVHDLQCQGIPIVTELKTGSEPISAGRTVAVPGGSFIFQTSNTTSTVTRWVKVPFAWFLKKSEMLCQMLEITEQDCSYLISPLCFIQSCWALLIHLMAGAAVWIDSFSTSKLCAALRGGTVTTMVTVPSIARTIAREAGDIGTLRLLVLGGDFADESLIDSLRRRWPPLKYANVYGCTETAAADLVLGPVLLGQSGAERYTLGRPSWYSEVSVRDADSRELLGPGQIGLIWVKSPFLCRHYLGSSNPLTEEGYGFCTGDAGYQDTDGYVHYCGRDSGMMKYNGNRVSALEIESALLDCPAVREAVAFAIPHALYGQIPACCVILNEPVSRSFLETHLKGLLEPYKIPRAFYVTDALPKTVSGKVSRNPDSLNQMMRTVLV